ncbi:unnamed protein product [Alopecurus aequalis]
MDAYEATKVVFSRIQVLDADHAAKIMGLLLVQDHGEKEMIRLAFGPEVLLQSVMAKARRELGLLPASSPGSPPTAGHQSPFQLSRQNSGRGGAPSPLSVSSPSSWSHAPVFSRSNGVAEEMASPVNSGARPAPFFPRAMDDFQLQEELAFLNDGGMNPAHQQRTFDGGECQSPGPGDSGGMFPYGLGWANGGVPGHRRSASENEVCLGGDNLGWKPCLYYARGFCKNGSSCRFVHAGGLPDDDAALAAVAEQQQCHDFLLRSKSQHLGHAAFPYSTTSSLPGSPSAASKCLSFLLQQQHNDNQRAAAALMLGGGDETHKFMGRPRLDRADFASMMNPGSRQIYLTFPADSTFREEDVSGYFSIYGPVHDVRIPYQQKRMFGFVTFMYPETVRLILAKGNPHFICDARVLVKPYKEKGKVPDKYRKQPQGDFSGCTTPTGLDGRDPFDLHQLGGRMLQHSNSANELMLRRKLEEEQQAAEFQHAVELQSCRLMSLQLLDLKSRVAAATTAMTQTTPIDNASTTSLPVVEPQPDSDQHLKGSSFCDVESNVANGGGNKEESPDKANRNTDSDQSGEQELPQNPFASPTKSATLPRGGEVAGDGCNASLNGVCTGGNAGGDTNHFLPSALDMPSPRPYFFPMSRLSSDHGAIGM